MQTESERRKIIRNVVETQFPDFYKKIKHLQGFGGYDSGMSWLYATVRDIIEVDQGSDSFNMSLSRFRGIGPEFREIFQVAREVKKIS